MKLPKVPLSSFSVGHLLLGMQSILKSSLAKGILLGEQTTDRGQKLGGKVSGFICCQQDGDLEQKQAVCANWELDALAQGN